MDEDDPSFLTDLITGQTNDFGDELIFANEQGIGGNLADELESAFEGPNNYSLMLELGLAPAVAQEDAAQTAPPSLPSTPARRNKGQYVTSSSPSRMVTDVQNDKAQEEEFQHALTVLQDSINLVANFVNSLRAFNLSQSPLYEDQLSRLAKQYYAASGTRQRQVEQVQQFLKLLTETNDLEQLHRLSDVEPLPESSPALKRSSSILMPIDENALSLVSEEAQTSRNSSPLSPSFPMDVISANSISKSLNLVKQSSSTITAVLSQLTEVSQSYTDVTRKLKALKVGLASFQADFESVQDGIARIVVQERLDEERQSYAVRCRAEVASLEEILTLATHQARQLLVT